MKKVRIAIKTALALWALFVFFAATAQSTTRLQPWPDATVVATEGQAFTVPPKTVVWYGAETRWVTRVVSGSSTCSNSRFYIDPFAGKVKKCVVEYPPPWVSPGGLKFPKLMGSAVDCAAAPKGNGTVPVIDVNGAGVTFAWWCKVPAPAEPTLSLYAVRWSAINATLVAKLVNVLFASDYLVAIRTLSAEQVGEPIDKLYDVWGPSEARLVAARPASAPQ